MFIFSVGKAFSLEGTIMKTISSNYYFNSSKYDAKITEYMKKKRKVHSRLKWVSKSYGVFYTIMADEVTNSSNKEQFVMCLHWVDKGLNPHEEFIDPREVPNINASTLASCIWDAVIRMNLSINKCRGKYYDGASNIACAGSDVASQVKNQEPRTISTHCYGH